MHGERRRRIVEELLGVIVGEDDPEIGLERAELVADVGGHFAHMRDQSLVLGVGHGEELGRVGQHGAPDHGRHHGCAPRFGTVRLARRRAQRVASKISRNRRDNKRAPDIAA
jgi:hypothetical protein